MTNIKSATKEKGKNDTGARMPNDPINVIDLIDAIKEGEAEFVLDILREIPEDQNPIEVCKNTIRTELLRETMSQHDSSIVKYVFNFLCIDNDDIKKIVKHSADWPIKEQCFKVFCDLYVSCLSQKPLLSILKVVLKSYLPPTFVCVNLLQCMEHREDAEELFSQFADLASLSPTRYKEFLFAKNTRALKFHEDTIYKMIILCGCILSAVMFATFLVYSVNCYVLHFSREIHCTTKALDTAAIKGELSKLRFYHEQCSIPLPPSVCSLAAKNNDDDIIDYYYASEKSIPIACLEASVRNYYFGLATKIINTMTLVNVTARRTSTIAILQEERQYDLLKLIYKL